MRLPALILFIIFPACLFGQKVSNNIIQLPLIFKNGYGAFPVSLAAVGFENLQINNPWSKTYLEVSGIPKNWKNVKKGMIWFDARQFVYQNYVAENISSTRYNELQKAWNWKPVESKLSSKPLKCFVYVATGEDDTGRKMVLVDTNNDLDLSDEKAFIPVEFSSDKIIDSLADNAIQVSYEKLYNGKIITTKIPLLIVNFHSSLWYNFPEYAVAYYNISNIEQEIAISSGEPGYYNSKIIMINDTLRTKKANADLIISKGEYISLNNTLYINRGVDLTNGVLELEKAGQKSSLYSTQINFKAIPFKGKEFTSKENISLDKYKGKFLYLDFWGTWCGPCLKEIPNINAAYNKLEKSKIEILGIVGQDNAISLKKGIKKEKILWPQILSDAKNKIVESYAIDSYPTSFLLNPEGIIIAKNLRGEDLYNLINKLITK